MKAQKPVTRRAATLGLAAATTTAISRSAEAQPPGTAPRGPGLKVDRINPKGISQPRGYTHVVSVPVGRTIYISGQVAADATGALVGKGDFKAQVAQVFANLKLALEAVGAGPGDVVKTNIYVVNLKPEDVPPFRETRNAFSAGVESPASTLVGVTALANPDYLIEIEAVAFLPPQASQVFVR